MTGSPSSADKRLSDLPEDALRRYAADLGLDASPKVSRADLLRHIRERRELLLELDRQAMLDIVVWARHPVRKSASKEELAKTIARIDDMRFDGLGHRGLVALARLRGVDAEDSDSDEDIIRRMRRAEGFWTKVRRRRRRFVGAVLERAISGSDEEQGDYQFLPEDPVSREPRLRDEVESRGIVGGLAGKLRTVADDYIAQKLDEIENRIDEKLDEIDARLAEWRDREVANRLRIIKITLVASVIVALLSLGYKYASTRVGPETPTSQPGSGSETSAVADVEPLPPIGPLSRSAIRRVPGAGQTDRRWSTAAERKRNG